MVGGGLNAMVSSRPPKYNFIRSYSIMWPQTETSDGERPAEIHMKSRRPLSDLYKIEVNQFTATSITDYWVGA